VVDLGKGQAYFDEISKINNELANAQRELAQKNHELAALNEKMSRFLGMASHDLRGSLSILSIYLNLLENATNDNQKDSIENMQNIIKFMTQLVGDFLEVSQIQQGKLHLRLQKWCLVRLVNEVVLLHQPMAKKRNINLIWESEEEGLEIWIDGNKLRQVITNLINNALKFSPEQSTVTVTHIREETKSVIQVKDNGPGIPESEQEDIFQLYTTSSVTNTSGEKSSGLGLAIAKNIIEAHGGTLWVQSKPGEGSLFSFSLPKVDPKLILENQQEVFYTRR
jgi:two-component system OmpR family sensor kinase